MAESQIVYLIVYLFLSVNVADSASDNPVIDIHSEAVSNGRIVDTLLHSLLILSVNVTGSASDNPVIDIDSGAISGKKDMSNNGRQFFSFEGIPYAEPPVGELRFAEPVPVKPWSGVKITNKPGNRCLQLNKKPLPELREVEGKEDCLYINVYSPTLPEDGNKSSLSVLVFIHGGAYMFGSGSSYGPKYLMDEDVVYVTFNYRLGVLGFASMGDSVLPGNYGLKDQVLALQWVQKNIGYFGGDPESVTLTGFSVGGISVHYHYLSPLSAGLFHRGISFSGTALDPKHIIKDTRKRTAEISALLNCPTHSSQDMVKCLRSQNASQLVNLQSVYHKWLCYPDALFGPVIEPYTQSAFLTEEPVEVILNGRAQSLPWMANLVTGDGLNIVGVFADCEECLEELNSDYKEIFPEILLYNATVSNEDKEWVSNKIREKYFHGKNISRGTIQELINMESHRINFVSTQLAVQLQAKYTSADVYSYMFDYRGAHSNSEAQSGVETNYGASHGDDVCYFLNYSKVNTNTTEEDRKMRNFFMNVLMSYIKTGIPSVPDELRVTWVPENKDGKGMNFLYIIDPENVRMVTDGSIGNSDFWHSLPFNENNGIVSAN